MTSKIQSTPEKTYDGNNMDREKIIQKQNRLLNREFFYRKIRFISTISGSLLFAAAGICFSKGYRLQALILLIMTIIGYAIAADVHVKLFHIDSIRDQRAPKKDGNGKIGD
ncbi:MAG: hypothetical protein OEV64_02570 [Desulfobulbaceae bacterium]|nr:hypothetical protein [Desulfobulbaceae bacterium]